jgi:hypothetical protein
LESSNVQGTATGYFHFETVGDRWWLIAPDGKGDFVRAIALLDSGTSGVAGDRFRSYDKVVLQPSGGGYQDVSAPAMDSNAADVLQSGQSYTVENVGDSIFIGSARFQPEYTRFQAQTLGSGGSISWYYLNNSGVWTLVNTSGKPYGGDNLNSSSSYSMDVGNQRGVGANGFLTATTNTDKISWWNPNVSCPGVGSCTWPSDFTMHAISGIDATPRYWMKGVVETTFTTAPVLSQIYEAGTIDQVINARYSGIGYTPYVKWLSNDIPKLINYGFNAAGQASDRYWQIFLGNANGDGGISLNTNATVPTELSWDTSDLVMRTANSFTPPLVTSPIKNIMGNQALSYCPGYEGRTPDVFDPNYQQAMTNSVQFFTGQGSWAGNGNTLPDASKFYAIIT